MFCGQNPTKILRLLIMNLKKSPFSTQDKTERDLDNATDFPTLADLMREQNISTDQADTVHHRRDLDSLG